MVPLGPGTSSDSGPIGVQMQVHLASVNDASLGKESYAGCTLELPLELLKCINPTS